MEISLIRHPPVLSDPNICHGQYDFPVNDSEIDFYFNYYDSKLNFKESKVYTSPLKRCLVFAKRFTKIVNVEERLAEYSYGDWEGEAWDTIDKGQLDAWMQDFQNIRPPNGENLYDLKDRIFSFLISLPSNTKIILITHLGVMRVVYAVTNNIKLSEVFDINIDYGDYITLNSTLELVKYERFNS